MHIPLHTAPLTYESCLRAWKDNNLDENIGRDSRIYGLELVRNISLERLQETEL
jgi:hypothetical protein